MSAVQDPTALASIYPPAWPERGKNWKTKAPRPQALPAEVWGRQARGGRLRREGGVAAAPEHKNNEARGAMGPSRLVPESLSDLDRCHSWAPGEEPPPQCCRTHPHSQAGSMEVQAGPSHRQPPHQVGVGSPQSASQLGSGGGMGGCEAREWGQDYCRAWEVAMGSPEGNLALRCGNVCEKHTERAIVLVEL